jgi:hypothetical protein
MGGGMVAGVATGAAIGVASAGPVGVVIGATPGAVADALGGVAAGASANPYDSSNAHSVPTDIPEGGLQADPAGQCQWPI